ncbi:addiction module protein [Pedobacter sp. N23S346]|uniref:addiction module protein n=1 Tax=Pedobacter sp. N23S346 TaxID=3402750 RepID=UPI003ACE6366
MMIKEEELLSLNDNEKLAVINLLQSSLFDHSYKVTTAQQHIVEERLEKIEKGETKFFTFSEFQNKLNQRKY